MNDNTDMLLQINEELVRNLRLQNEILKNRIMAYESLVRTMYPRTLEGYEGVIRCAMGRAEKTYSTNQQGEHVMTVTIILDDPDLIKGYNRLEGFIADHGLNLLLVNLDELP